MVFARKWQKLTADVMLCARYFICSTLYWHVRLWGHWEWGFSEEHSTGFAADSSFGLQPMHLQYHSILMEKVEMFLFANRPWLLSIETFQLADSWCRFLSSFVWSTLGTVHVIGRWRIAACALGFLWWLLGMQMGIVYSQGIVFVAIRATPIYPRFHRICFLSLITS